MDSRHLIDMVVRQTTVLIAQLATSAGIRAPVAHLADQVFVDLAREIEEQGVSRKVAADMFGMALRSYQRRVARLSASRSVEERTLWQAVLEHVAEQPTATPRARVLDAFPRDEPQAVVAVLNDLVASGLLYATGRGRHAAYGATSGSDREALLKDRARETLLHLVWLELTAPAGVSRAELEARFPDHAELVPDVLQTLEGEGRLRRDRVQGEERLSTTSMTIPVGAEVGWEVAVFDHFRAVCTALASKLSRGGAARAGDDLVGGTTLAFDLHPGHPFEQQVKGLLAHVRQDVLELWQQVSEHNAQHPPEERDLERVIFYLGQNHIPSESNPEET